MNKFLTSQFFNMKCVMLICSGRLLQSWITDDLVKLSLLTYCVFLLLKTLQCYFQYILSPIVGFLNNKTCSITHPITETFFSISSSPLFVCLLVALFLEASMSLWLFTPLFLCINVWCIDSAYVDVSISKPCMCCIAKQLLATLISHPYAIWKKGLDKEMCQRETKANLSKS